MSDAVASAGAISAPAESNVSNDESHEQQGEQRIKAVPKGIAGEREATAQDSAQKKPAAKQETAPEKPQAPDYRATKHKVKINDQEMEVDYDELTRGYQKSHAGDARLREAAEKEKKLAQFIKGIESGSMEPLIQAIGYDRVRDMAMDLIHKEIEWNELPDHERKIIETERKAKSYEEQLNQYRQAQEQEKQAKLRQEAYSKIETDLTNLFQNSELSKLEPKNRTGLTAKIVDHMRASMETGKPLSAAEAKARAFRELDSVIPNYLSILPDDKLRAIVGDGIIKKIKQWAVAEAKENASQFRSGSDQGQTTAPRRSKFIRGNLDDAFEQLGKKFG